MRPVFLIGLGVVVGALVIAFVIGMQLGSNRQEHECVRRGLEDSLLRIGHDLQLIEDIGQGKSTDAIALLDTMNYSSLVYLMHFDKTELMDGDFARRRTRVLSKLMGRRPNDFAQSANNSLSSDPNWVQYQKDIEKYLKESTTEKGEGETNYGKRDGGN